MRRLVRIYNLRAGASDARRSRVAIRRLRWHHGAFNSCLTVGGLGQLLVRLYVPDD